MFLQDSKNKTTFTKDYWLNLRDFVLKFLVIYEEELDDTIGGRSLYDACFRILKDMNKTYIKQNYEFLISFIYQNILEDKNTYKIASLIVFRSLLEVSPEDEIQEHISKGFSSLLSLMGNSEEKIIH